MDKTQPLPTIASRLGTTVRTLRAHSARDGFPAPTVQCGKCGSGLLYDVEAVLAFEDAGADAKPARRHKRTKPQIVLPLAEIAEQLGVTANTLRRHTHEDGFPVPVTSCGKCSNALVYVPAEVKRFEEGAPVDPSDQLMTLQEAASELGLSYGSMRTYLGRHEDFPKPLKYSGPRPLFSLHQIRSWQDRRERTRSTVKKIAAGEALEVDGLLTRAGVAKELVLEPDSVTRYLRRDTVTSKDFPEPVRKIGAARLWDPKDIRAWDARRSAHQS